ncbi:MAG: hypothetical protein KAS88_00395 [Deltaproteobacteria bacterium]|nr:hypothetical protein [Deltaproteobacteria bacterium]
MNQQFLIDTADKFRTYIYADNICIVPSSATITIYKPGGDVLLVDSATMGVEADGLLTYELSALDNATVDRSYKSIITYIYDGETYYISIFYDVVHSRLTKVITDDDLVREFPQLKDAEWRVHGTADSGTTTTIVDEELKRYAEGYFTGGLAYSIDKDETREITDFVASSATVTVKAFGSAVISDKYILTRSFLREIERAFEKIEERLIAAGKRPELVLDSQDLRSLHIYASVAEVAKGLSSKVDDFWWTLWKEYDVKADRAFAVLPIKYDTSGDGYISSSEDGLHLGSIRTGRG